MVAKLARSQLWGSESHVATRRPVLVNVGDLIGNKYRVERFLGEGGMGVVVAAHHELLDQPVAVKLLYHDVADSAAQTRMLLEARSAAKLQSEHVARVIDVDVGSDGLPFIVMELLQGSDLCQVADSCGPLPRWLVVDYMLQALEGLAHAHGRGIVHRDLKPSNLFLTTKADGTQIIKILDFGISKSADDDLDRRFSGGRTMLGSPPYMSPEQVKSPKSVDHRTDIWSLGVCMYELLTNSMPFGGGDLRDTFEQIVERKPTPIRALVVGVPEGLEQIVMKCLAKKREDRFSDVAELARALAPFGSGTWLQSASRIQSTLLRSQSEDLLSSSRVRGIPLTPERVALASASARRRDSVQPEFTGTASTITARLSSAFESKRGWLVTAILVPALIGVSLIGLSTLRGRGAATVASGPEVADDDIEHRAPSTAQLTSPLVPASSASTPPTAAQGTVLGASPGFVPPAPPGASSAAPKLNKSNVPPRPIATSRAPKKIQEAPASPLTKVPRAER